MFSEIAKTVSEISEAKNSLKDGLKSFDPDKRIDIQNKDKTDEKPNEFNPDKKVDRMYSGQIIDKIENVNDKFAENICEVLSSPDRLKDMITNHPEFSTKINDCSKALEIINDPKSLPIEINSANGILSNFKGELFETSFKDELKKSGFDVQDNPKPILAENNKVTVPDIIAKNISDKPIVVFGNAINPGEYLKAELKCGCASYISNQLIEHIPKQLSGLSTSELKGKTFLITTADVNTYGERAKQVCDSYNAKLIPMNISSKTVTETMKGVLS